MQMYEVGGCIRDELLGVPSKDIDFTVVLDEDEVGDFGDPFEVMKLRLQDMGFKIFVETPEFFTIRAQFPGEVVSGTINLPGMKGVRRVGRKPGLTADFVLARREGNYADGRRPEKVEVGTLEDDLRRRDFTMNAIAKDADGSLIDPFDGVGDISAGIIRAVGDPYERLSEDALRAVRALRFSVTKRMPHTAFDNGFEIEPELAMAMQHRPVLASIRESISDERISDELSKMFRYNTHESLLALYRFPHLTKAMFSGRVSLDSTMKQKGRRK